MGAGDPVTGRLRRPGAPWRLLVHEWLGAKGHSLYGTSHHVTNDPAFGGGPTPDDEHRRTHVLEGTEFDELVVGKWATVHIEQLDSTLWWACIGGVTINIRVDRDGRPKRIDVYGPGDHAPAVEGVTYNLTWSASE